jgi:hypothetical protein
VNYTAAKELRGGGSRGPFHALLRRPELADRVSFVQRSAHQSQACLTLATNGVEIGNSRFRCASRMTATSEVAPAAILRDARQKGALL